jgi:transposase
MFGRETRMLLRHYLERGTSKSALARQLGVSRDTVHRRIRAGELDRDLDDTPVAYGPRRPIATKLDQYRPIVETRLAAYPELSAVRLLEEIRAAGYTGGYSQLKALVRQLRPAPAPSRWCASKGRRGTKRRWTSRSSTFPGVRPIGRPRLLAGAVVSLVCARTCAR